MMPNSRKQFDPARFAEAIRDMGWDADEFRLQVWQRYGKEPARNQVAAWLKGRYTPSGKYLPIFGEILNKPLDFFYTDVVSHSLEG